MEGTLKAMLNESSHQSKILKKLLASQTSTLDDNKKGEKDESSSMPQNPKPSKDDGGPLNPNTTEVVTKAPKRKRMSTQTQRHEDRKRQRQSAKERRREREASMILEKKDHEKTLADLKKNTKKIVEVVQAGKLKEVIDKSK